MRDKDPASDSDDDPPQNIIDQPPESSALLPFRVAVHTCCLTLRCVEVPPGTVAAVFPSEQGARRGHCRCAFSAVLLSSAQLVRSLTFMAPAPVPATPPCFPRTWGCRRLSSPQPVVSGAAVQRCMAYPVFLGRGLHDPERTATDSFAMALAENAVRKWRRGRGRGRGRRTSRVLSFRGWNLGHGKQSKDCNGKQREGGLRAAGAHRAKD